MRRAKENRRQKTQLQNYIIIAWKRPPATEQLLPPLPPPFKGHISNSLLRGIVVSWMKNEADKEELVFLLLPAPIAEEASTFRSWSWWLRPLTKDVMVFVECLPKYYCITTIYYLPIRPTDRPQAQTASDNWLSELYFAYFVKCGNIIGTTYG